MAVSRLRHKTAVCTSREASTYLDRTCVVRIEVDYGLSAAGNLDLVLRAEPRHDYMVLPSVWGPDLRVLFASRRTFDCVRTPMRSPISHVSSANSVLELGTYDMVTALHSVPAHRPHSAFSARSLLLFLLLTLRGCCRGTVTSRWSRRVGSGN